MDQSKKTMRHFYCRDVLWETFEQMANDFDCSIDYLINEAMRYYARSKNYHSAQPGTGNEFRASTGPGGPAPSSSPPSGAYQSTSSSSGNVRRTQPPPPPPGSGRSSTMPPLERSATYPPQATPERGVPAQPRRPQPPAPRMSAPQEAVGADGGPTLFLVFNSQKIPIEKDQFIIGRGSKTSDLAIKDGNISRKHAAVIRRNGTYYIKDLGSTNGIDYKGMRIDNKRIDEGDVFHLCDYELRFTYR
jgi:pSer/pThr/pTyr-binding forkhead associated (FHA) protein